MMTKDDKLYYSINTKIERAYPDRITSRREDF